MVEHTTHNRVVGGSNPPAATTFWDLGRPGEGGGASSSWAGLEQAKPPAPGRILVAISGGADSTALLSWLTEQGREVVAAHFDHALRLGSAAEADHVARLCRRLQVGLIQERRSGPLAHPNLEAAARQARYEFLERARGQAGCASIATAHTADDVVEGVLMHLRRGCALAGLRGIPRERGMVVRPLARVWRREVLGYLRARRLGFVVDPTNLEADKYTRSRVRHQLLPALEAARPGIKERLLRVAERAEAWQEELETRARNVGDLREGLKAAPAAVRYEAYRQLYGDQPALERRHLAQIDSLLLRGRAGQSLDLPRGRRLVVSAERVAFASGPPAPAPDLAHPSLHLSSCPGCEDPRAVHLEARLAPGLSLGARRPGLRLRPAPHGRERKVQDVLVDARVPRAWRDQLPLVFSGPQLAWIPGVALDVRFRPRPGAPLVHVGVEGGAAWRW